MRARSLQVLTNELKARYPGIVIYGVGDDEHKTRYSDHNEDDTAGSKAAQSDSDSIPEHRAIDAMHGSAFTVEQGRALVNEVLAVPNNRKRLYYINHENDQWSRTSFTKHDNSDDPHPTHIHFSGWAPEDDNTLPWLGGSEMELTASRGMGQNGAPPSDNTKFLQRLLNVLCAGDPRLSDTTRPDYHPLVVDGNYGGNTAFWVSVFWVSVGVTGGDGNLMDGDAFGKLIEAVQDRKTADALNAHNANTPHGGELPDTVEMTIPAYTVPAQTVTVPIE